MDEDERHNAYERAMGFDHQTYIDFAKIVQHYGEEAYPPHDDIDFVAGDPDSLEVDFDGEDVISVDPLFIIGLVVEEVLNDLVEHPEAWGFGVSSYNPLRGRCKGHRRAKKPGAGAGTGDSE